MHFPALIQDLAVILGIAALVTFIFKRIKQPVVLGYIVAGVIIGPHTPAFLSVSDTESIKIWAELGVIFLMFGLGLEFSFRRLARVGMSASVTAVIQIVFMLTIGILVASALGWHRYDAIFLGCMIAISSTTIIIKALEELKLKTKRFAELVFGILIVEDLAAILMLVALTNIATTSQVGGIDLLIAAGKLAIVVGAWFVVGMFLVPRFVKLVGSHGNDEMLTVVSIGLCLALVAVAAYFHYSVALGAFIMGSILAESAEAKKIEHLTQPLQSIFGAVFFVSVGMMLEPKVVIDNLGAVALISLLIIVGKILSVSIGAFATGQSVRNSIQTGFSMAQIGEFSFIIASLGLSYEVISEELYPIIVASSLITTFTTPYLVKFSGKAADMTERLLPDKLLILLNGYGEWIQRRSLWKSRRNERYNRLAKWSLNAIVVIALFQLAASVLIPFVSEYFEYQYARWISWVVAFALSSPSIWAMLGTFRENGGERSLGQPSGVGLFLSRIATIGLLGMLSSEFFPALFALVATVIICGGLFIFFRKQLENYYQWIEAQFQSGFQAVNPSDAHLAREKLAPWDAHLVEIKVPSRSFLVGNNLLDLQLREKYGLNVVVIVRDGENIVAPKASEVLYPGDLMLCFATDQEIDRFKSDIEIDSAKEVDSFAQESYELRRFMIRPLSQFRSADIKSSGIHAKYDCIVVGLERNGKRIPSPKSETVLAENDVLWIVGERSKLGVLAQVIG